MNTSKHAKLQSVLSNGTMVCIVEQDKEKSARIYCNTESRGYQTGYIHKQFFYLVGFKNGIPTFIHGITKDAKRKNFIAWWTEQQYTWKVLNQLLFDQLMA